MRHTRPIPPPESWESLRPHPLSQLSDFGAGIILDDLAHDMRNRGYNEDEPIVLFGGLILDGRHRHAAAVGAEVVPAFVEFTGSDDQALLLACQKLNRQHLSISQRSMAVAALAEFRSRGGDRRSADFKEEYSPSRPAAAQQAGVSVDSVDFARVVNDHGTESLKRAVRVGTLKVSDAAKVARTAQAVQDYAVEQVEQKKAKTVAEAATLCNRCHKRLTKDHKLPVEKCVKCADIRLNGKPKMPKKPKPAPALAAEPPAEQQELPAMLAAIAFALTDYIERAPLRFGKYTDPRQPELKTAAEGLVADLEDWTKGMAGDGEKEKLFDNQSRGGPRGYGH